MTQILVNFFYTLLLTLLTITLIVQAQITSITKGCSCTRINTKCVSVPYCKLARKDKTTENFTIDAFILREEHDISLHIKQMRKRGSSYVSGHLNVKMNLCDIGKNVNGTQYLSYFGVDFFSLYGELLHPCPYHGRMVYTQLFKTVTFQGGLTDMFLQKGEYKTMLTFYAGREICFVITYLSNLV